MFRKLVSNLPFSPALIADIGFYAKRLREEEITRKITVLFVILTLIMQSLAIFSPPESANASSEQDIIHGGISDLNDLLRRYDRNEEDIRDIFSKVGINRNEIAAAQPDTISANNTYAMSRYGQLSSSEDEVSIFYQRSSGGTGIRYFSPLTALSSGNITFTGWTGRSSAIGWFGIIKSNGSIATHGIPTTIRLANTKSSNAVKSVAAINLSQGLQSADKTIARPLDKLKYTLKLSNPHTISVTSSFSVRINDLLEYSSIIDEGGGTYNAKTKTLSWPQVQLGPGQSEERTFAVQLLSSFPSTATGQSNPASYDCRATLVFGNELNTSIQCPPIKAVEGIFSHFPNGGVGANILFGISLLIIAAFFYLRTRQLKKEIKIIRHNFNAGINLVS